MGDNINTAKKVKRRTYYEKHKEQSQEDALRYYYDHREEVLAKQKAKRERDKKTLPPEVLEERKRKNRERSLNCYHRNKAQINKRVVAYHRSDKKTWKKNQEALQQLTREERKRKGKEAFLKRKEDRARYWAWTTTEKKRAQEVKIQNIIDMAVGFSAMGRSFAKGSLPVIREKLYLDIERFLIADSVEEFEEWHETFCQWFTATIRTSGAEPTATSWGQAAKVLDVVLKVCIHYSKLPTPREANRMKRWLHAPLDGPMLRHIQQELASEAVERSVLPENVVRIKDIQKEQYIFIQKWLRKMVESRYLQKVNRIMYDDLMWRELNR